MSADVSVAQRLGRAALDLVFPPRCVVCGRGGNFVCDTCVDTLVPAAGARCQRCWRPDAASVCVHCDLSPPAFDARRAAFVYAANARELVHALKFRGVTAVAGPMAALMADSMRRHELAVDLVAPVPLAGLRRRTRGYNQAESLARPLARELALPLATGALARKRSTRPQTQTPGLEERRANVAGAFEAKEADVAGRRVLVVDDVTTSGSTLDGCAASLKVAGAKAVVGLTFAIED